MAATKFSVITTGDNPTFHVMVKEIPTECTYKIAVTIAKAVIPKDERIIAVIESWKLYPNENEKTEKN
jgi:hypothetical protein